MADGAGMPRPVGRDGKVLIPTVWQLLARDILEDPGASASAKALAEAVLEAAG